MSRIRTVHVGVRGRGRWPLELLVADGRFEPVAIVGRQPMALDEERELAGLSRERAFSDLGSALDAVDCDAVVVCTPVECHAGDLRVAFAAGKHVLVEKCLSNDWAEAVALVDEADAAGVRLVVAQNYRFTAVHQTLHHAVSSGLYGQPMLIDLALHKYRPAPRQQDYPFAMFWDQGCHHVDALQWVFGPIVEVSAQTFSAPWSQYRDDAALQALLRFESGAVWTYLLSNVARVMDHRFLVQSDEGALDLQGGRWRWKAAAADQDASFGWNDLAVDVEVAPDLPASGEHGVIDAFARSLAGEATPIDGRSNLETLRVCEMVQRSGSAGLRVHRSEVA